MKNSKNIIFKVKHNIHIDAVRHQLRKRGILNVTVVPKEYEGYCDEVDVRPDKVVKIVDLANVWQDVGMLPDDPLPLELNGKKKKLPAKKQDGEDRVPGRNLECPACKRVVRSIDCKREREENEEGVNEMFFCPRCGEMIDSVFTPWSKIEIEKLQKLLTLQDLDRSKELTHTRKKKILRRLILMHTSAKPGWSLYIYNRCYKDPVFNDVLMAYDQKIYSSTKAWKMIMKRYEALS